MPFLSLPYWLAIVLGFEAGLLPYDHVTMYQPPEEVLGENLFYVQFEVEAELFDHVFVGGRIRTYMWKGTDGYDFFPNRDDYLFTLGFRIGLLEVGWRHFCTHPDKPGRDPGPTWWDGSYEELYISVRGRIGREPVKALNR